MTGFVPKEKLTAYQRWEVAAFDEAEQAARTANAAQCRDARWHTWWGRQSRRIRIAQSHAGTGVPALACNRLRSRDRRHAAAAQRTAAGNPAG